MPWTGSTCGDLARLHALADDVEHLRLDVHGQDLALGPDLVGEAEGVVAAAGADVGHHVAGLELQRFQQLGRLLLTLPLRSLQPAGPRWPITCAISRSM